MELSSIGYADLRYNIKIRLDKMDLHKRIAIRKQVLKIGLLYATYYKLIALKKEDSRDMGAKVLLAFAKAMNIEMEHLFNS